MLHIMLHFSFDRLTQIWQEKIQTYEAAQVSPAALSHNLALVKCKSSTTRLWHSGFFSTALEKSPILNRFAHGL